MRTKAFLQSFVEMRPDVAHEYLEADECRGRLII